MKNKSKKKLRNSQAYETAAHPDTAEKVYTGIGVSTGIVIGKAYVHYIDTFVVPREHINEEEITLEQNRFETAAQKTITQIAKCSTKLKSLALQAKKCISFLMHITKCLKDPAL